MYIPRFKYPTSIIMEPQEDPPNPSEDFLDLAFNDTQENAINDLTLVGRLISLKVINFKAINNVLSAA